jgi:hypothetical protein
MELSPTERIELRRRAMIAGEAGDVLTGLAIPGLAVWKHLPELLFNSVKHGQAELWQGDPDAVLVDTVRGGASLLCWIGTRLAPLKPSQEEELRAHAAAVFSKSLELGASVPTPEQRWGESEAAADAVAVLPFIRRAQLFASHAWTRNAVRALVYWGHTGGVPLGAAFEPPSLSFDFRSNELHTRLAFEFVPVETVIQTHDTMVAFLLWDRLGLAKQLAPVLPDCWARRVDLRRAIDFIFSNDLSVLGDPPTSGVGAPCNPRQELSALSTWRMAFTYSAEAEFSCRLYELPELARIVIGRPEAEVTERCDQINAAKNKERGAQSPGPSPNPTPANDRGRTFHWPASKPH